jgi:hypothetical protein
MIDFVEFILEFLRVLLLPKITDLDRAWKIGLAEIQYTHSWYIVMNNKAWLKVHFYKESELQKHLVLLPNGYSTKGQYTYREFNPFLTSTTQSETYSPAGNIACLNPNMDCITGLMMT